MIRAMKVHIRCPKIEVSIMVILNSGIGFKLGILVGARGTLFDPVLRCHGRVSKRYKSNSVAVRDSAHSLLMDRQTD